MKSQSTAIVCHKVNTMKNDKGFSLIELLIVVIIVGVIAAIAVPNLLASRRAANGAAAMQAMRVFHSVQSTYQAGVGTGNFGTSEELASQNLIDESLLAASTNTRVAKSGYVFAVTVTSANNGVLADFNVLADVSVNSGMNRTGDKNFYVDSSGVIRASTDVFTSATSSDTPIGN